ncbi:hypothetical protein EDC96DRAFT_568417 [Choanephora cucurbitarum]|nr:hypothetical protein EDC96DRAFT_568417 [Choanephora cucurbitarum]
MSFKERAVCCCSYGASNVCFEEASILSLLFSLKSNLLSCWLAAPLSRSDFVFNVGEGAFKAMKKSSMKQLPADILDLGMLIHKAKKKCKKTKNSDGMVLFKIAERFMNRKPFKAIKTEELFIDLHLLPFVECVFLDDSPYTYTRSCGRIPLSSNDCGVFVFAEQETYSLLRNESDFGLLPKITLAFIKMRKGVDALVNQLNKKAKAETSASLEAKIKPTVGLPV